MPKEEATHLSELLYNNAPPNNLDLSIIRHRSEVITKRIAELRDELVELEDQLRRHECVSAPMRRMPAEILTMIFEIASTGKEWWPDERDMKGLIQIGLVCKRWRDVVFGSGSLWVYQQTANVPKLTEERCDKLVHFYRMSKRFPRLLELEVATRVHCECHQSGEAGSLCSNPVVARLLKEGSPFSQISFANFSPTCFKNLVHFIKSTTGEATAPQHWWDSMRTLSVGFSGEESDDPEWFHSPDAMQPVFAILPNNLTSLTLRLPDLKLVPNQQQRNCVNIPVDILKKLTTFSFSYTWGGPQFLTALQHCTNVEDLSLRLGPRTHDWTKNTDDQLEVTALSREGHLVLPKVKYLNLRIVNAYTEAKHIGYLRFPGLLKLKLDIERDYFNKVKYPYSSILEAAGMFSAASPKLESLRLGRTLASMDLWRLLNFLPTVTRLSVYGSFDAPRFLEMAQAGLATGKANVAPSLQFLEVYDFDDNFHLDSLLLWVKSRQKHGKQKGKIVLKAPYDGLKWIRLRIAERDRGIKKVYYRSATLKLLREWINVERVGFRIEKDDQ